MSDRKRLARSYDPEFRKEAARLVIEGGMTIPDAAKDLGMPMNTLDAWVRRFRLGSWSLSNDAALPSGSQNTSGSSRCPNPKSPNPSQRQHDRLTSLERHARDLEIKLKRMTQERDILKKAMAYCLDVPK